MSLNEILREAVQREASDVLLIAGLPVSYKVNGHICREGERLFPEHTRVLVEELYSLRKRWAGRSRLGIAGMCLMRNRGCTICGAGIIIRGGDGS